MKFNIFRKNTGVFKEFQEEKLSILERSQQFFSPVYGLEETKENVYRALISETQVNVLLTGPAASGKTLLVEVIRDSCTDVCYFDSTNTSGAGLIEVLYQHQNAKVLIIDEIDKLKKNDLNCLLGLLNNGSVDKALKTIHYKFKMNVKVFATCNSNAKLSKPIRSRFQEYCLPVYSDDDFIAVVKFCLATKLNVDLCEVIAQVLIENQAKDVRLAKSIAALINKQDTQDDVERVISNYLKHRSSETVDYN